MILYFNDYKLIYIITMMGKINNIPVLNEDVIRLVVLNEEIIGYIYPRRTSYVVALEIKPGRTTSLATSVNKQCMVLLSDKVRLATEQDFDDFHICFDGFRNNTMYCYNQGTEPNIPSMKHILPSFGLGKGGYFAVRYFLASTPKK